MTTEPSILVIEDDTLNAELLEYLLKREGYMVTIIRDGLAAQKRIAASLIPPRLVLLDLLLPVIDGYQLIQQIRAQPQWSDVPVIVLSGKTQEQDIVRAFNLGVTDYITKPFQLAELLARVRCQINRLGRSCYG